MTLEWYDHAWKYRRKITIDHNKVSGTSNLLNFPLLVDIKDGNITSLSQSSGQDILFTDDKGNKLDHELDAFDVSTGSVAAWIRIPTLRPGSDLEIYLYWGNRNCSSQQNATGVWDSNYKAVWHMNEINSLDSTSNANHLTSSATPVVVSSKIRNGVDYESGSSQYASVNDNSSLDILTNLTLQCWVRLESLPAGNAEYQMMTKDNSSIRGFTLSVLNSTAQSKSSFRLNINNGSFPEGSDTVFGNTAIGINTYYLVHAVFEPSATNKLRIYINGVVDDVQTSSSAAINNTTSAFQLAAREFSGSRNFFDGILDECRVSNTVRSADWMLTEYNNQNSPSTFYSLGAIEYGSGIHKHYYYKVYTGNTLTAVWTKEVISEPRFRTVINGGPGEMNIELARPFDDFNEDVDVKVNNRVDCYVVDREQNNGQLLYSGYISGYRPLVDGPKESVIVTVFGYVAQLSKMILRDSSGNTTLAYNSQDPSNILKDVINKANALGCRLGYSASSVSLTGTVVSYTFNTNTIKECLDKVIELCPVGWYWRVDPDGYVYLQPRSTSADNTFTLGLDVEKLETFRRIEDIVNRVLFVGAGDPPLFLKFENTGSQSSYGLAEIIKVDQRVSDSSTAATISNRIIDNQKDPEIRSRFVIIDSNGPTANRGYDIESVKVGETLVVKNLRTGTRTSSLWDQATWDTDLWDQSISLAAVDVIQILSIDYTPDSITIEASSRLPEIAKRVEDINRNLVASQTAENPTAPS